MFISLTFSNIILFCSSRFCLKKKKFLWMAHKRIKIFCLFVEKSRFRHSAARQHKKVEKQSFFLCWMERKTYQLIKRLLSGTVLIALNDKLNEMDKLVLWTIVLGWEGRENGIFSIFKGCADLILLNEDSVIVSELW